MDCSTPGFPVLHCLPEFAQIHVHWIGDAIELSHLLLPSSPLAFHLSQNQGLFQGVCYLLRWPKYWRFSFSISSSNEYSGLISFRIDWLDLLAAQGTLKGLLQHHSLEALILWCSAFLMSNSHICMWLLEELQLGLYGSLSAKWRLCFLIHCLGLS